MPMQRRTFYKASTIGMELTINISMVEQQALIRSGTVEYSTTLNMRYFDFYYPIFDFGYKSTTQMGLDLMASLQCCTNIVVLISASLVLYL